MRESNGREDGMRDITGKRFGRRIAQWPCGLKHRYVVWLVLCDCGKYGLADIRALKTTHSCGCAEKPILRGNKHSEKHGMDGTPEYWAYQSAKSRCTNPKNNRYENYGGRGIEFRFKSFQQWYAELGRKPGTGRSYSVDRIDNDKHYEPGNVHWATPKQQANNRRRSASGC